MHGDRQAPTSTAGPYRLRCARPADGDAVARLFTAALALLDFLRRLHSADEDRGFIRKVIAEQRVTVAEDEAGILGFIAETSGWVNHLYVDPGRLRRGIGSALLGRAQGRQSTLSLWCFQRNLRARRFYEANGFEAAELTDGAHNEAREPDVRFVWQRAG